MKAKICNFSYRFFWGKLNISKLKFVELFFFVSCSLRENYVRSWAFPAFSAFSVRARKLNQQPAMTYDMGNRDFVIKRNKVNASASVDIFFVALLFLRRFNILNTASIWGTLACLPHMIRHKLQSD